MAQGRAELCCAYIVDAEEAERHDVRAPLGPGAAGAAARRDPAPVKHHRHVVRALGGHHLRGHHGGTQMETYGNSQPKVTLRVFGEKVQPAQKYRYMPFILLFNREKQNWIKSSLKSFVYRVKARLYTF